MESCFDEVHGGPAGGRRYTERQIEDHDPRPAAEQVNAFFFVYSAQKTFELLRETLDEMSR